MRYSIPGVSMYAIMPCGAQVEWPEDFAWHEHVCECGSFHVFRIVDTDLPQVEHQSP